MRPVVRSNLFKALLTSSFSQNFILLILNTQGTVGGLYQSQKKLENYLKKNGEITQVEITDPLDSSSGQNLLCVSDICHHLLESILITLQLSSKDCDKNPEIKLLEILISCSDKLS